MTDCCTLIPFIVVGLSMVYPIVLTVKYFREKPAQPIYHGDGLWQLPDRPVTVDHYTGEVLDEQWAARAWQGWADGCATYNSEDGNREVCPHCYYVSMVRIASDLAATRPERDSRARWRESVTRYELMVRLLGACRCIEAHPDLAGQLPTPKEPR